MKSFKINRAIISVWDKSGILPLANIWKKMELLFKKSKI